jgi:DNA-nicking Smr family endonuclease
MGNKHNKTTIFSVRPFEKLRKKLEAAKPASPSPPVPKPRNITISEEELFSTAMDDVQEIEAFRDMPLVRRPKKVVDERERRDPDRETLTILSEIAGGQRPIDLPDTQEYVEWMNPEFRGEIIQKLHAGQFSVQSFLDLHGCTVIEADTEVEAFLKDSFQKGLQCVKIIHGRGLRSPLGPTLKTAVIRWLSGRYRKSIIAYVTARQCDGGLGALYVLLRKK